MKSYFVYLCLFFLTVGATIAQPRGGRNMSKEDIAERFTAYIRDTMLVKGADLEKVEAINMTFAEKTMNLREEARGGNRAGMREKMLKLREEHNAALGEVLSEEQINRLNAYLQSQRRRGPRP